MKLEEALAGGALELSFIGRALGVGGIDPDTNERGLEIYRNVIRYVAKRDGVRDVRTLMDEACDRLGK